MLKRHEEASVEDHAERIPSSLRESVDVICCFERYSCIYYVLLCRAKRKIQSPKIIKEEKKKRKEKENNIYKDKVKPTLNNEKTHWHMKSHLDLYK